MKLYVLTRCQKIAKINKEIVGIFNYNDGLNKKIMLETMHLNFNYSLDGPYNVNVNEAPINLEFEPIVFPEVPKTPLQMPKKNNLISKNLLTKNLI